MAAPLPSGVSLRASLLAILGNASCGAAVIVAPVTLLDDWHFGAIHDPSDVYPPVGFFVLGLGLLVVSLRASVRSWRAAKAAPEASGLTTTAAKAAPFFAIAGVVVGVLFLATVLPPHHAALRAGGEATCRAALGEGSDLDGCIAEGIACNQAEIAAQRREHRGPVTFGDGPKPEVVCVQKVFGVRPMPTASAR